MSELLRPITEFSPTWLGYRLRTLAEQNRGFLTRERFLPGVVLRYVDPNDLDTSTRVQDAQERHRRKPGFQAFAINDEGGQVWGMATIQSNVIPERPELTLRRQRVPLPTAVIGRAPERIREFLSPVVPTAPVDGVPANISAWVDRSRMNTMLHPAYEWLVHLVERDSISDSEGRSHYPWTVEPLRAPTVVHRAIEAAGLHRHDINGRYDEQEAHGLRRDSIPPQAAFYRAVGPS